MRYDMMRLYFLHCRLYGWSPSFLGAKTFQKEMRAVHHTMELRCAG